MSKEYFPGIKKIEFKGADSKDIMSFTHYDEGALFEKRQVDLEGLVSYARSHGEPAQISGQQEKYERLINLYI